MESHQFILFFLFSFFNILICANAENTNINKQRQNPKEAVSMSKTKSAIYKEASILLESFQGPRDDLTIHFTIYDANFKYGKMRQFPRWKVVEYQHETFNIQEWIDYTFNLSFKNKVPPEVQMIFAADKPLSSSSQNELQTSHNEGSSSDNSPLSSQIAVNSEASLVGALTNKEKWLIPCVRVQGIFFSAVDKLINNNFSFSEADRQKDISITNALMFMFVKDDMPLRTLEYTGFKNFVKTLQPLYNVPSELTLTKNLELKYYELREKFSRILSESESISLTAEIWTHSDTMKSYLGITSHFLIGSKVQSIDLCAKLLIDRKSIKTLRKVFNKVCQDWRINYDSVVAIVTDGGPYISDAVEKEFGALKHISCFAHKINNIGETCLALYDRKLPLDKEDYYEYYYDNENTDQQFNDLKSKPDKNLIKKLILRIKRIIQFFSESEVARSELEKLQMESENTNNKALELIPEIETRWNSCYMLESFLSLSDLITVVLSKLQQEISTRNKPPSMLNTDELETLQEIRDLLKPLWQVTVEISSEKIVTLSKCIPLINEMKTKINGVLTATSEGFNFKQKLISLIDSEFSSIELVKLYAAATLLDPRFKKEFFSDALSGSKAITYVSSLVSNFLADDSRNSIENNQLDENLKKLTASTDTSWLEFNETIFNKNLNANQDIVDEMPVELRQYLNMPIINRKKNPIAAWKILKREYPHVYKVALKFLPILATSVPAEGLFSHTGFLATKLGNRLSRIIIDLNQLVFMRSLDAKWFN